MAVFLGIDLAQISTPTAIVFTLIALALAFTFATYSPGEMLRWLDRKRYQYEVTFSLYMLTPTEKFIFNSVLFLFVSMFVIAGVLYLPEHLSFIASRAFYYYVGEEKYREQYHQADALRTGAVPPQGVNPEL